MSGAVWKNNDCITAGGLTPEHRAYLDKFFSCTIVSSKQIRNKSKPYF